MTDTVKCPFDDPEYRLDVSEPCPVCYDLGTGYGSDGVSRCIAGPIEKDDKSDR